jgi:hypothetical protein
LHVFYTYYFYFKICLANQVENASRHNQSHQTQPGVSQSTTVQPDANNPPRLSSSTAVGNAQVNEHRKLFGYAARGKQPKKGKSFAKQKVQTCSLKFVCLASRSAVKPPTTIKERTMLANACLGDGTVTFHVDGNSSHLHEKLLEAFPKLFSAGYELFLFDRSGENSSFCHLKPPYLPKKLKEVAGQCKIYIKPLQKELLDSNDNEDIEVQCGILCLIIALIYAFLLTFSGLPRCVSYALACKAQSKYIYDPMFRHYSLVSSSRQSSILCILG